jgi:Protein of unknown function (DUF2516)
MSVSGPYPFVEVMTMVAGVFTGLFAGALGLVFFLLGIAAFVVVVWALVDAAVRPTTAFQAVGQNKVLWVVLPIVSLLFFGLFGLGLIGGVIGFVYLSTIRPRVRSAQRY